MSVGVMGNVTGSNNAISSNGSSVVVSSQNIAAAIQRASEIERVTRIVGNVATKVQTYLNYEFVHDSLDWDVDGCDFKIKTVDGDQRRLQITLDFATKPTQTERQRKRIKTDNDECTLVRGPSKSYKPPEKTNETIKIIETNPPILSPEPWIQLLINQAFKEMQEKQAEQPIEVAPKYKKTFERLVHGFMEKTTEKFLFSSIGQEGENFMYYFVPFIPRWSFRCMNMGL